MKMMATSVCPDCGQPIPPDDINVKEGVGLCRACGALSRLADIVNQPPIDPDSLTTPPAGCSYEQQPSGTLIVRASHRALGTAMGALALCLFWNGIVSVFVLVALAGLYTHFIGPLPAWFPVPRNATESDFGPDKPWGTTLFLCIFLIPFVLVGLGMIAVFLGSLIGRVQVLVAGSDGRVRTGFGPFNYTRRFDPSKVTRVTAGQTSYQVNNQNRPLIRLEADRPIKFGSMLPEDRRNWMLAVLRLHLILQRQAGRSANRVAAVARR